MQFAARWWFKFGCTDGALAALKPPRRSEAPAHPPKAGAFLLAVLKGALYLAIAAGDG
jgi:hypothetical protein